MILSIEQFTANVQYRCIDVNIPFFSTFWNLKTNFGAASFQSYLFEVSGRSNQLKTDVAALWPCIYASFTFIVWFIIHASTIHLNLIFSVLKVANKNRRLPFFHNFVLLRDIVIYTLSCYRCLFSKNAIYFSSEQSVIVWCLVCRTEELRLDKGSTPDGSLSSNEGAALVVKPSLSIQLYSERIALRGNATTGLACYLNPHPNTACPHSCGLLRLVCLRSEICPAKLWAR